MPFTSIPKLVVASNVIANLPRRAAGKRPITRWDPFACNPFEQEAITNALTAMHVYRTDIADRGGDWVTLANLMAGWSVASLDISCDGSGQPVSSNQASKSLNVNMDTSNRRALEAWLVVELIHLSGGTDLDAWGIKNWLFNIDKANYPFAYFPLLASELALMCSGSTRQAAPFAYLRAGKFTVWDPTAGNLWPSTRNAQGQIVNYGTSLIDSGPPTTYWRCTCP